VSSSDQSHPPKWREDFPFEHEGDDFITRRDFTRFLCLISAGFVTGQGWVLWQSGREHSLPTPQINICAVNDLQPGHWRVFNYPDEKTPAILIRRLDGEFTAFLQKCTHLACPVAYNQGDEEHGECLTCHCHSGRFDIENGEGISGPPRELRPLPQLRLSIEGERVVAVGFA
jgi:nitrite reductase/ring-hydroxylating ferredoxin subunit